MLRVGPRIFFLEGLVAHIDNCEVCRRYLKLLEPQGAKNMQIQLTDAQIVRLLELCNKIGKIQHEVPAPPTGAGMASTAALEIAKSLRASLERENDSLVELGALLR